MSADVRPDATLVTPSTPESDAAIELVEARLSQLFTRARAEWKESAALVHPGLQPIGYKLLATLVRSGPQHAGAIAEELATDKSVISRQLRILEEFGFVVSSEAPDDRRARVITATPLAIERIAAVREGTKTRFYGYLGTWTRDELSQFADLLGRLAQLDVPPRAAAPSGT